MAIKDKYSIERKYVTNSKARSKAKLNGPRYFVAHETANSSADADAHYRYFQGIKISASAHTFIDDGKILEIIPLDEKAWHVQYQQDRKTLGLGAANDNAVGTELCRTGNFAKAYDRFVWYHAYLCKKYGKQPKKHITAHKFEDPQRRSDPQSWLEPNGVSWNEFINDVQAYFDAWDGDVKVEIKQPAKTATTTTSKKSNDQIAQEVIAGKWGNGADRESRLKKAGYNPDTIQNEVNAILSGGSESKAATKSINTIANEVIAGKWSSGDDRKNKLKKAGYDANKVQAEVNRILGAGTTKKKSGKSIDQMAKEVIAGKHGSGHDNRRKSLGISASEYEKVRKRVNQLL